MAKTEEQIKRLIEGGLVVIYSCAMLVSPDGMQHTKEGLTILYDDAKKLAKQTVEDFADALEEK